MPGASSSAVKAGEAFVEIGAKLNRSVLDRAVQAVVKKFGSVGKAISGMGLKAAGLGAAILTPLALMQKIFVDAGSAATDMAERLGTTTETVTALGYAAGLAGGTLEDVESNLGKMQKTIAQGAANNDAFFAGLLGKSVDEQLDAMADLIAGIKDKTLQSAAAMELFGKSGRKMLPFLREGAEGLAKLREQAGRHGGIITSEEAARADRIGDAFSNIHTVVNSIGRSIGSAMMPDASKFEGYADMIAGAGATVRRFIGDNAEMIRTIGKVGMVLVAGGGALTAFGEGIGLTGTALSTLASIAGFVFSPTGLVVTGVALLTATLITLQAVAGHLNTTFATLGETVSLAFNGITSALKSGDLAGAANMLWETLKSVGSQILLFFEKLWNELKAQGKIAGHEIGFAIATALREAMAEMLPKSVMSDEHLAKVKKAHEARRAAGTRDALMTRDADNSEIDEKLKKINDALKPNGPTYAEIVEGNQPAAKLGATYAEIVAANEGVRAGAAKAIAGGLASGSNLVKGAFAGSADKRSFAFGDRNDIKDVKSVLEKILEAEGQGNKHLERLRFEYD